MKRIIIVGLVIIAGILAANTSLYAETMTNDEFAYLLVRTLEIDLPQGTDALDKAESYEVMANMLASRGLDMFVGADPDEGVTCSKLADVVFILAGLDGTGLTFEEKSLQLGEEDLMQCTAPGDLVTIELAAQILNNPRFAALVPEAYTEPEVRRSGPVAPAPNITPENPASEI